MILLVLMGKILLTRRMYPTPVSIAQSENFKVNKSALGCSDKEIIKKKHIRLFY